MSEEISLADELRSHLQADETPAEPEAEAEPEAVKAPESAEPAVDTPEKPAEPTEPEDSAKEETPQDNLARPPATWSATAKAEYAKLPDTVRKEIAKREADFSRGIQKYAEKADTADRYNAEIQPYEQMFRRLNATPEQFMRDALSTEYKLRTISPQEKTQLLMQYAEHYGADLSILPQMLGMDQQPNPDQGIEDLVRRQVQQIVNPLQQKVRTWEQQSAEVQQRQALEQQTEIKSQIDAFQNDVNESGQPKHLFFENVRGTMAALIERGEAKSLDQAYEMACYANNEVRATLIAQQQSEAEAKRLEEAKRRAVEAKRSSFDVSGQGGVGVADTSKLSLRDEIQSQMRGNSRV